MKAGATIQRKCLNCKTIYDNAEMWLGIKKCPNCFNAENFVYVNKKGKKLTNCQINKPTSRIDYDIRIDYKDKSCRFAFLWSKKSTKCTDGCPFKPDCIEWLSNNQKSHLIHLLNRRRQILNIYNLADSKIPRRAIVKQSKYPESTVYKWLRARKRYEPIIKNGDLSPIFSKVPTGQ